MERPTPIEDLAAEFAAIPSDRLRREWVPRLLDSLYGANMIRPGDSVPRALLEVLRAYDQAESAMPKQKPPRAVVKEQERPRVSRPRKQHKRKGTGTLGQLMEAAKATPPGACSMPFRIEAQASTRSNYVTQVRRELKIRRSHGRWEPSPLRLIRVGESFWAWEHIRLPESSWDGIPVAHSS